MAFSLKSEEYYKKFIELQEKLRKSEEERLKLEMKFNEMVRVTREEEQMHFRKLRSQYKRFLEEDRRRQDRNERILRNLEGIDRRIAAIAAKTERFKFLKQQYQMFLKRMYEIRKTEAALPPQPQVSVEHKIEKPKEDKNDIVQSYVQNLSSNKLRELLKKEEEARVRLPYSAVDHSQTYFDPYTYDDVGSRPNYANSIADDIVHSLYTRIKPNKETQQPKREFNNNVLRSTLFSENSSLTSNPDYDNVIEVKTPLKTKTNRSEEARKLLISDTETEDISESDEILYKNPNEFYKERLKNSAPLQNNEKDHRINDDLICSDKISKKLDQIENNSLAEIKVGKMPEELSSQPLKPTHNKVDPNNINEKNKQPNESNEIKLAEEIKSSDDQQFSLNEDQKIAESESNVIVTDSLVNKKEAERNFLDKLSESSKPESQNVSLPAEERVQPEDSQQLEPTEQNLDLIDNEKINLGEAATHDVAKEQSGIQNQQIESVEEADQHIENSESNQHTVDNNQLAQEDNEKDQPIQQYDDETQLVHQNKDGIFNSAENTQQQYEADQLEEQGAYPQQFDDTSQHVEQYADNAQSFQQYDEQGQPIQSYDQQYGDQSQFMQYTENAQYDENGQMIPQYVEQNQIIPQYDDQGQLIQQYDESGQLVQQYPYDESQQQYDENGQLIQQYDYSAYDQQQIDEHGQVIEQPYGDQQHYDTQIYDETTNALNEQERNIDTNLEGLQPETIPTLSQEHCDSEAKPPQEVDLKKSSNVMEMLDTDTESTKQDTKVSHDSDFDFSNN